MPKSNAGQNHYIQRASGREGGLRQPICHYHRRWLASYDKKGGGKQNLTYDEAVEEALCFGWIDSRPNTLEERWICLLPGNAPGRGSTSNGREADRAKLVSTRRVARSQPRNKDGSWSLLDAIEELKLSLTSKKL